MKKLLLLILAVFVSGFCFAQETESDTIRTTETVANPMKIILSATYVTQHYWRGIGRGKLFGDAPSFEPQLTFVKNRWTFGVSAGASFDNIYKTVLPFVIYSVTPEFSVAVQDIYSPGTNFWHSKPFDFNIATSKHFVDYYMIYRFKKFPVQLKWASIVLGKDANADGKRNFSTYAEISSGFKIRRWQADGYVGATPWKGLYAQEAGINNLEAKIQYNLVVHKNVPFPVFVKVAHNPISKMSHVVGGCTVNLTLK